MREDLDQCASRVMCVLNPMKVTIRNIKESEVENLSLQNHPKTNQWERGLYHLRVRFISIGLILKKIQHLDSKELVLGGEVRLRGSYVIKCEEILRDSEGEIIELICSADRETLGRRPEGRKVKESYTGYLQYMVKRSR